MRPIIIYVLIFICFSVFISCLSNTDGGNPVLKTDSIFNLEKLQFSKVPYETIKEKQLSQYEFKINNIYCGSIVDSISNGIYFHWFDMTPQDYLNTSDGRGIKLPDTIHSHLDIFDRKIYIDSICHQITGDNYDPIMVNLDYDQYLYTYDNKKYLFLRFFYFYGSSYYVYYHSCLIEMDIDNRYSLIPIPNVTDSISPHYIGDFNNDKYLDYIACSDKQNSDTVFLFSLIKNRFVKQKEYIVFSKHVPVDYNPTLHIIDFKNSRWKFPENK